MNRLNKCLAVFTIALSIVCLGAAPSPAQSDIRMQISSQETYVGMPVTLLIQVEDVDLPEPPKLPNVDGLDIRSSGTPSRSSTISIINGRRSESSSVTYSYSLTPRHEGTFEVPSFTVKTAGGPRQTRPFRISATTSETGDLMFAEVAGQKQKLFVGQPIDLTLRIWLKPYRDQKLGVTISASDMWRMITEQTQWGAFAETLEKMASEGKTIEGQEVLRKDKNGVQRSYYLYEVPAKFYPKHAGQIEMGDVQIVAQYPTKLGKSRDPFESFFGDSPFGRGMFDDDFFKNRGFSPFGQSLTVTAARPIVVSPEVAPIEVTPIPTMGRPADYRGAVGQYQMITQATPAKVKAGDPITLKIGIRGTGPMELVQAPPLATLPSLTSDFKVSDEPLAGIVQDDIKVFTTSVRPRREGISQVPSIPFSFFDPETEKFVTVQSEPISIEVDKAEKLALDSIVGGGSDRQSQTKVSITANDGPAFENYATQDVLTSQQATPNLKFWLTWFLSPAALLGLVLLVRNRQQLIPKNTARVRALAQIQRATETADVSKAILEMIASKTGGQHANLTRPEAVTVVSRWVDSTTAEQLDRFLVDCEHATYMGDVAIPLVQLKQQARHLVASLARLNPAKSCSSSWKARVQRPRRAVCATALALVMIGATAFSLYNVFRVIDWRSNGCQHVADPVSGTKRLSKGGFTPRGDRRVSTRARNEIDRCGRSPILVRHGRSEIPDPGRFRSSQFTAIFQPRQCVLAKRLVGSGHRQLPASRKAASLGLQDQPKSGLRPFSGRQKTICRRFGTEHRSKPHKIMVRKLTPDGLANAAGDRMDRIVLDRADHVMATANARAVPGRPRDHSSTCGQWLDYLRSTF